MEKLGKFMATCQSAIPFPSVTSQSQKYMANRLQRKSNYWTGCRQQWASYESDGEKHVFRFFNHASSQTLADPGTSDLSDECLQYISTEPVEESVPNPLDWWRRHQQIYPDLSRTAFDLFAVPAMPSECGRALAKLVTALPHCEAWSRRLRFFIIFFA